MKLNLVKRVIIGSFTGGLIGYVVMHPIFMVADYYIINHVFEPLRILLTSFTFMESKTSILFIVLGLVTGSLLGLYSYRINILYKKFQLLSITDDLTQIYNRRHFTDELRKEIERSKRFSLNLSLIILDIDKFKYNNDTYGHIFGDRIIKSIAVFLTQATRKIDFIARYGGDEFVIFMPETEKNMANVLAERLQLKLSQYSFNNYELPIKNTLSIGIAGFPNDAANEDELIHHADIALYAAKKEGGNRVCNFEPPLQLQKRLQKE